MTSIIFSKIIKSNKGSVEFIESAIVYKLIFIALTILLLFTTILLNKIIINENIYYSNREILNNVNSDFQIIKNIDKNKYLNTKDFINKKSLKLDKKEIELKLSENLFFNKITSINKNKKIISKKFYQSDLMRKGEFASQVIKDVNLNKDKFSLRNFMLDAYKKGKEILGNMK